MAPKPVEKILWRYNKLHGFRRFLFRIEKSSRFQKLQAMRDVDDPEKISLKPFDANKCIFIHIPKTAGCAIANSLFGNPACNHFKIKKYMVIFNRPTFNQYFKFTFVRNPWDRLVSGYHFLKDGGFQEIDEKWAEEHLSCYESFDSFVRKWVNRKNIETKLHFVPQYKFLCVPGSMTPRVDFIGYYENIENDFLFVKNKINPKAELMKRNASNRKKDYRGYYTKTTRKIVEEVYKEDIMLFGYDF